MARQINAIIKLSLSRLNAPLAMLRPRVGNSYRVAVLDAPEDCTDFVLRVFRPNGAYFDIPGNVGGGASVEFYIIGTCFPESGAGHYELRATDAEGNHTALGAGLTTIDPFSVGSSPIVPGEAVTVAQIPAKGGGFVQIRMVQDETGEWVYEAIPPNGEVEG